MRNGHKASLIALGLVVALTQASPAWAPPLHVEPLPPEPVAALPAPEPPAIQVAERELRCLAKTVYWEAGQEPAEGQRAVAHVVLNRVGQRGFAPTICGVVEQGGPHFPCQFHWYCNGSDSRPVNQAWWEQSQRIARQALAERDPTEGALYFHQAALHPDWSRHPIGAKVIGKHVFFRGIAG